MKKLIVFLALAALPLCGAHAYFNGSLGAVNGAHGYSGMNGALELGTGSGLYIRPAFDTYKADGLDSTFATYMGRAGYDKAIFSLGVEGGVTPKQNGYGNIMASGDATVSLSPTGGRGTRLAGPRAGGGGKGEGIARVDIGAKLSYTRHEFDAVSDKIGQTDGTLFAGVMILGTQISASYTKNLSYSQDITNALPEPLKVMLPGTMINTTGYINQILNARIDFTMLPLVTPFASYTATQYKTDVASGILPGANLSRAYQLGVRGGLNMVNVNAAYQVFDPGEGHTSASYYSLGAGINF